MPGEAGVSYLTQMIGLAVQNYMSAAVGMAVLIAFIYGFSRRSGTTIGNFWVLLIRSVMILLPFCVIIALILVSQGTVQTFNGPVTVPLLDPVTDSTGTLVSTQTIPLGPAASQIAIKQLGTNGGGFFNANSAHPFENPTPVTNFLEILVILLIPAALCYTFGKMIGSARKGIAILIAMTLIFIPLLGIAVWSEVNGNPAFIPLGIDQIPSALQPGGNMEGKEVRFGPVQSAFFSVVTTVTSCGAVNSMHDSFMPLGGFVQMFDMQLGEIVFGGVGSGLYCMLIFVILAMFIAGLMVGRTPELYGKKIEPYEMTLSTIHHPHPDLPYPRAHGHCSPHGRRFIGRLQPRTPRVLGDPVCVQLGFPEQRQCVWRFVGEQRLLQPCDSIRNVRRALCCCHHHPRTRGIVCRKEDRTGQRRDSSAITARSSLSGSCLSCLSSVHSRTSRRSRSGLSWNISP